MRRPWALAITPPGGPPFSFDPDRRALLRAAYQEALGQARELATAIGLTRLAPVEVLVEGGARPVLMRAMVADGAPPFDPAELPPPTDRIALQVRFCAR